jgi:hypothetical protein
MKNFDYKVRFIFLFSFLIILMSSCSDILDQAPEGKLSMDEIFSDEEKIGAFLNTCYSNIGQKGHYYYLWSRGPVDWSDDAWDAEAVITNNGVSTRLYRGEASAASHPIDAIEREGLGNYWNKYWTSIRYCSQFIQYIEEADINPVNAIRWKAEAHVLRAYYYMELLQWFGTGLPIQHEPFDITGDLTGLEKPSYYETVKFIIEDCDAALNNDYLPWRITLNSEVFRVTKAVAAALKSRAILFAASPLYNEGEDHWNEAYEINKASLDALKSNGYELYNQINFPATFFSKETHIAENVYTGDYLSREDELRRYAAMIYEFHTNYPNNIYDTNPVDKETIWQDYRHDGPVHLHGALPQGGAIVGSCPTQEIVDAFETIDGQPILNIANPYNDENHLVPNYNENNFLYNEQDPYKNRDPRFYADIYFNGTYRKTQWPFQESPSAYENYPANAGYRSRYIGTYIGEPNTGRDNNSRNRTHTGYYIRKFVHPTSGVGRVVAGPNTKHFRLGEIILNFAEAAAGNNKLDEARLAVNEIRNRVGMPDLPTGLSKEELIIRIRHERRIELAFETHRYFDVRRWSTPDGDLSKTDKWLSAIRITRKSDGSFNYERDNVVPIPRECYTNKYLRVAIPLAEANRLAQLTGEDWQNPGW